MPAYLAFLASSTGTVSLFLALLAVLAQVSVLVAFLLWGGGAVLEACGPSQGAFRRRDRSLGTLPRVGGGARGDRGEFYFSEIAHFVPCKLCWYQRICMYPLVVVLGVAAWRQRTEIAGATLPLVAIGAAISTYHYLLERFPSWEGAASCDPSAPCTIVWVWRFHYLSIPAMALSGFALIAVLILTATDPDPTPERSEH